MSHPTEEPVDPPPPPPGWVDLTVGAQEQTAPALRRRRVLLQVVLLALVVVAAVAVAGVVAARRLAEAEAVADAAKTADLLAELLLQPALQDGLLDGDPGSVAAIDGVVREHVLAGPPVVRLKVWDPTGRVLYSDEPRLIGQTFPLGQDEREVFAVPATRAEVSDLAAPENVYERGNDQLLETYRPVWTPSGAPLLFEAYFRYDEVTARSSQLFRGFAGITLSSLLLLVVLLLPVLWRLLDRLSAAQRQRESLLQRAVDASAEERRRIAGTVHDGVVQDLVATSFAVAGAAERAATEGRDQAATELRQAAATVRSSIGGLRSLLLDIYPPRLADGGLTAALQDLAGELRVRGIDVRVQVSAEIAPADLNAERQRLIYRVARECLGNVGRHSGATAAVVSVRPADAPGEAILEIVDNGVGFDADQVVHDPPPGHFGVQVLADVAAEAGASLRVRTAPGAGTRWQLRFPT
ncbi:integral membrane sensor signal transduction histidine kinase [Nakamurella flava]|uniref:Integral membrane sensor signal transduction histidine kinase n=1 Tax=Nakamurella flava TaxID=2576308 RepID=A0A4U6QJE4_9ACTN|nr:histidine kinase [Nakamurella flava]TKV60587.1 integral membrane sensor signal transduction histidine kinase [Nakamurella flava]